jgi:hypothetical protein
MPIEMRLTAFVEAPTLHTERLRLRHHLLGDVMDCVAMWSDPDIARYTIGEPSAPQRTWLRMLGYRGHWQLLGSRGEGHGPLHWRVRLRRIPTRLVYVHRRTAGARMGRGPIRAGPRICHRSIARHHRVGRYALRRPDDRLHHSTGQSAIVPRRGEARVSPTGLERIGSSAGGDTGAQAGDGRLEGSTLRPARRLRPAQ